MATTPTPTPTPAPKPTTGTEKDRPYDPADELSPPFDPAKAKPYKPAPTSGDDPSAPPTKTTGG